VGTIEIGERSTAVPLRDSDMRLLILSREQRLEIRP
jgi:hypothetical protein